MSKMTSRIANGILGVVAGALALGAVQLENARSGTLPAALTQGDASLRSLYNVDRTAKADRLGLRDMGLRDSAQASSTLFVYPVAMPDMLIAARMTRSKAVAPVRKSPPVETRSNAEPKIACEPLMSVLVVEAANLQPGRCLV